MHFGTSDRIFLGDMIVEGTGIGGSCDVSRGVVHLSAFYFAFVFSSSKSKSSEEETRKESEKPSREGNGVGLLDVHCCLAEDGGLMGVRGSVVVVKVATEDVGPCTTEGGSEGNMVVEEVMEEIEVVGGFARFCRDFGQDREAIVDILEVEKISGVVASKNPDKIGDLKVTKEKKGSKVIGSRLGDVGGREHGIEGSTQIGDCFGSEGRCLSSEGSVCVKDGECGAEGGDIRCC